MAISPNKEGGGEDMQEVSLNEETMERLAGKIARNKPKPRRTKNEWRSIFAFILLVGFLVIISFVVMVDQIWGSHTPAAELLSTVGNLITSPLSFVIGYYYKENKGN